ncbi:MAG: hypothetical protein LBQ39_01405 [Tannerellaceae bacterium]|jgi:V/A-type H+-transporting ATPase subunit E|nr:hypothetical protein [Tannerellaceae bacterium]
MDTKIQELTDKIYREGVEKGNEEAARIIAEANAQKQALIGEAEAEAKRIITAAEKQSADIKKNTEAELKLHAAQVVEALKSEVANLIAGEVASSNVKAAIPDRSVMQLIILEVAKEWVKKEPVTIQVPDPGKAINYFMENAKDLLDKGVKIEEVNGKKAAFAIMPSDGSYKVTFGEEEFISFFKEFLRPYLIEMLF